jgi:hypothetical protein
LISPGGGGSGGTSSSSSSGGGSSGGGSGSGSGDISSLMTVLLDVERRLQELETRSPGSAGMEPERAPRGGNPRAPR